MTPSFKHALVAALLALALPSSALAAQAAQTAPTARATPAWVKDAVIYEVWPRAFSPSGDLKGVTAKLDELKKLGVTIVWLMPIQTLGKEKSKGTLGSPYAIRDYYAVNPEFGTPADLKRLVAEAHKRGMKVITDQVINHTSWDNVLIKSNPEFYTHDASGKIIPPMPDWSDVADLNYDNPGLRAWMVEMLVHWIKEYDLDGFRCDVAWGVPVEFWEQARAALDKVKPNLVMIAESEVPELLVKAFEVDYSWGFHTKMSEAFMGYAPASQVRQVWEQDLRKYPRGALRMRFTDNHDERRAIARFGERGALAAAALVFTLDGVPMIYNGQEVGDPTESGAPALFEKLPIFWSFGERRPAFAQLYPQLIDLRKAHPALRQGEVIWVANSEPERVLTFVRRAGNEEVLVAVNVTSVPFNGTVEVPAGFSEITPAFLPPEPPRMGHGGIPPRKPTAIPAMSLDAWGFRFFVRKVK